MATDSRQAKDGAMKTGDLERHFDEERYQDNIDLLNTGLAKLGFSENMNGQIFIAMKLKQLTALEIKLT